MIDDEAIAVGVGYWSVVKRDRLSRRIFRWIIHKLEGILRCASEIWSFALDNTSEV